MVKDRDSKTEREMALYLFEPTLTDSAETKATKRMLLPLANAIFDFGARHSTHEDDCMEWRREVLKRLDKQDDKLDRIGEKLLNDYEAIEDLKKTVEEKEEVTGVQHKEELLGQLAEYKEAAKWWKRWVLGIVAGFILLAGGGTVGYVVKSALASGQSVTGKP